MGTWEIVGIIAGVLVFLFLLVVGISMWSDRRVVTNRYEWLLVMSHYEWKRGSELRKAMLKLKKSDRFLLGIMYHDLSQLEEEKFIESRPKKIMIQGHRLTLSEYKLTPSGSRRKAEGTGKAKQGIGDDLQPV